MEVSPIRNNDVKVKTKSDIETNVDEQSEEKTEKNVIKFLKSEFGSIKLLVFSCIIAPSWDVYSDLAFTIQMFKDGDPLSGISMMVPQLTNVVFACFAWNRWENKEDKRWSWIFVIFQFWPQLFAARIVWKIIKGIGKTFLLLPLKDCFWKVLPYCKNISGQQSLISNFRQ